MSLHLEVASLDFGKRWQAQGYGQAKLTLMQATTSEYLQHLSKAGSISVTTKEEVVAGTMHHLSLEIIEAGKELYEEKLWVKPWLNFNELQELKLAITMYLDGGKFQEMVKKCNMFPDHAVYFFLSERLFSFCQGFTKKALCKPKPFILMIFTV
uniref:Cysteine proteinase inhibitor n=1 Tax=Brassica oleracea var. oleracea TaxID=109376 RepID=A0A0D3AR43_BRAOL